MADEWEPTRLGDHITIKGGLSYKGEFVGKGDALLIGMGCVSHTERFLEQGVRWYGGAFTQAHLVEPGDLVIATRQQSDNLPILGFPATIPNSLSRHKVIVGTNLYKVENRSGVSNRFLYWLLRGREYRDRIVECAKGTTVRMLTKDAIEDFRFLCPPAREREAIASILDSLDDRIYLNRGVNETLEAMARALFKSWFVDFDPVRAKMEGRDPGLPKHIADLFPARLVDSEFGEIPEGWSARTIGTVCSAVIRGVTPKYEEGSRRYIINQRVNRGAHLDLAELKELDSALEVRTDCYAKHWDVLINCLGEGTLGRVHLFKGPSDLYVVDQHMSICREATPGAGIYIYQTLASPAGQDQIQSLKTGSTGMTMFNISKLRGFELLWPGDTLVAAYFGLAQQWLERIAITEVESQTLVAVRDALLPKLISGELRVKAAERLVAEAV